MDIEKTFYIYFRSKLKVVGREKDSERKKTTPTSTFVLDSWLLGM